MKLVFVMDVYVVGLRKSSGSISSRQEHLTSSRQILFIFLANRTSV